MSHLEPPQPFATRFLATWHRWGQHHSLVVLLLCAWVLWLHGSALQGNWRWDDGTHLLRSTQYSLLDLFGRADVMRHASGNQMAPFNLAIYMLNIQLFGLHPTGFYAQHLVVLAMAGMAFWWLLHQWLPTWAALVGAGLLIAGVPVQQMAQQLMVGHYLLGLALACVALGACARSQKSPTPWRWSMLAAVTYGMACFCKEIYVPTVLIMFWLPRCTQGHFGQRSLWLPLPCVAVAMAYTGFRLTAFQGMGGYHDFQWSPEVWARLADTVTALTGNSSLGNVGKLILGALVLRMLSLGGFASGMLTLTLLASVYGPLLILASSPVDWSQHARYLLLPWALVCAGWAVALAKPMPWRPLAWLTATLLGLFLWAIMPFVHERQQADKRTHAMFDAHYAHVTGSLAAQPLRTAHINGPGYLPAVLSAANRVYRQSASGKAAHLPELNIVDSLAAPLAPTSVLVWDAACSCLNTNTAAPESPPTNFAVHLPYRAPWPPMADAMGGHIEGIQAEDHHIRMRLQLPWTGQGQLVALMGTPPPSTPIIISALPDNGSQKSYWELQFSLPVSALNRTFPHQWCVVAQSLAPGQQHAFLLLHGTSAAHDAACMGLLSPAARR